MSGAFSEGFINPEVRPQDPVLAGPPTYWLSGSMFPVVPSSTMALPARCRGLWVGVGGTLVVTGVNSPNVQVSLIVGANTFVAGRFHMVVSGPASIVAFCD